MNIKTKILRKTRKNYYVGNCTAFFIAALVLIMFLLLIAAEKYFIANYVISTYMVILNIVFTYRTAIVILRSKRVNYKTVTIYSDKYLSILKKYALPIQIAMCIMFNITNILYLLKIISFDGIKILSILNVLALCAIESYLFNFIIIFSTNAFYVGSKKVNYNNITTVREFYIAKYNGLEEIIYFEMYNNDKYIGFDKFYKTDYQYLVNQLICKEIT